MTIRLDHTIVPAKDKVASAEFFAEVFGLTVKPDHGHFAQVQVNKSLTFDFAQRTRTMGRSRLRPQDRPEPSLRLSYQRGRIRRSIQPGEGQRDPLRQRAIRSHRRPDLHPSGWAWPLLRGSQRPPAGSDDSARDGKLKRKLNTMVWRLSEFQEGRLFTWETRGAGVFVIARHAIRAGERGSIVTLTINQTGWMAPLLTLLSGKSGTCRCPFDVCPK